MFEEHATSEKKTADPYLNCVICSGFLPIVVILTLFTLVLKSFVSSQNDSIVCL